MPPPAPRSPGGRLFITAARFGEANISDGRRQLVSLTATGKETLGADRRNREGWLAKAIEELPAEDQETVGRAIVPLRHFADADV